MLINDSQNLKTNDVRWVSLFVYIKVAPLKTCTGPTRLGSGSRSDFIPIFKTKVYLYVQSLVYCQQFTSSPLYLTEFLTFSLVLSSIMSTTDEVFNESDSKQCLKISVMAVVTITPSLGPNLCYWPAEDELSSGKKIKEFEIVNGTLQWPMEEIYITNCVGAQRLNLRSLWFFCVYVSVCSVRTMSVCSLCFMQSCVVLEV